MSIQKVIDAARGRQARALTESLADYLTGATGLVLFVLHPEPIYGEDPSYAGAKMVACMSDGKSTLCRIIALFPLLATEQFPGVDIDTYLIVWGPNIRWKLSYIRRYFHEQAARGGPPITKITLVTDDAMTHNSGHHQDAEAVETQALMAKVRHEIGDFQEEVGWERGGSVTFLVNVQYQKGINPFLRVNVTASFAYSFSMDSADNAALLSDFSQGDQQLYGRVVRWLKRHSRRKLLGDRSANSEALVKIKSLDICEVDFRRAYNVLKPRRLLDDEFLEDSGLVHYVLEDPDAVEKDTLELLLVEAGERLDWPEEFDPIRAEIRRISRDHTIQEQIRRRATVKGMASLWGIAKPLYARVREEMMDSGGIADPEELKLSALKWTFDRGNIPLSDSSDHSSGHHPQELLDVMMLASSELGDGVKGLFREHREVSKWLREKKLVIEAMLGVRLSHRRHNKLSSWYFFPRQECDEGVAVADCTGEVEDATSRSVAT